MSGSILKLQAKADTSCPLCFVWVSFQHDRANRSALAAGMTADEELHSMLVAGFWTCRNRNGELCRTHQEALATLDRMMHAARESLVKLPGGDS